MGIIYPKTAEQTRVSVQHRVSSNFDPKNISINGTSIQTKLNVKQETVKIIGSVAELKHTPKNQIVWDIRVIDKYGQIVPITPPSVFEHQLYMTNDDGTHWFDCDGYSISVTYLID